MSETPKPRKCNLCGEPMGRTPGGNHPRCEKMEQFYADQVGELANALAGLVGGVDNVNGQTVVQPHDVRFARAILANVQNKTA